MRRAGGWVLVLGLVAVAAMAAGTWVAFRPILNREALNVILLRGNASRDPSDDALESGIAFALQEAGGRAGRYRLQMAPMTELYSPVPYVCIGTSESIANSKGSRPALLRISAFEVPLFSAGELLLMTGFDSLGGTVADWAKATGLKRTALMEDPSSIRSKVMAESFAINAPARGLEICFQSATAFPSSQVDRILAAKAELVFYAGEEAPYSATAAVFSELLEKGYAGTLITVDIDPEVSFLAVPCRFPEGTLLISTLSPPSVEFAAKYEPATGRKAGPHAWPGYLAMRATLDLLDQTPALDSEDLKRTAAGRPRTSPVHALYRFQGGKFVFVRDLK